MVSGSSSMRFLTSLHVPMSVKNVILLGAGQIGSRHLQGLAKLQIPTSVWVVDPSSRSLSVAKQRLEEVKALGMVAGVRYCKSVAEVDGFFDLAIVATTADIRVRVFKELLFKSKVANVVFEKVLAQSLGELNDLSSLEHAYGFNAWVNCPNRTMNSYRAISSLFGSEERIFYGVQGGAWGLASNAIHYLDYLSFLTGETDFKADVTSLDDSYFASKRKGFIEFSGVFRGVYPGGSEMTLFSRRDSLAPVVHVILGSKARAVIDEKAEIVRIATEEDDWQWQEDRQFKIDFQSELTAHVAEMILSERGSDLPTLTESIKIHNCMLSGFLKYLERVDAKMTNCCLIT